MAEPYTRGGFLMAVVGMFGACQGVSDSQSAVEQAAHAHEAWNGLGPDPCAARNPIAIIEPTEIQGPLHSNGNQHYTFELDLPVPSKICIAVSSTGPIGHSDKLEVAMDGPKVASLKACPPDAPDRCILGTGMLLLHPMQVAGGAHSLRMSTKVAHGATTRLHVFAQGPAITSMSTATARPGETVTLTGEGFTTSTTAAAGPIEYEVLSVSAGGDSMVVVVPPQSVSASFLTVANALASNFSKASLLVIDADLNATPPFENPTFVQPPDDRGALGALLEAAGYGATANSDWVDIAGGNICGDDEPELVLVKNQHSYFSVMRGRAPHAVATSDVASDPQLVAIGTSWRAVAIGELFNPFSVFPLPVAPGGPDGREIVAIRHVAASNVADLVVLRANEATCELTQVTEASLGPPSNSDWVGVAIGRFDGAMPQVAVLKTPNVAFTVLSPGYNAQAQPTLTNTWQGNLDTNLAMPWRKLAAGDLDGDGTDELIAAREVSGGQSPTVLVYKWNGDTFVPIARSMWGNDGHSTWAGMTVGDFNADGRKSIALVRDGDANFAILSFVPGSPDLQLVQTAALDSVSGQPWRGLAAADWIEGDQRAQELIAVRKAAAPYRTDLFVYGNPFHRMARESGMRDIKGQSAFARTVAYDSQTKEASAWMEADRTALVDSLDAGFTNTFNFWLQNHHDYEALVEFLAGNATRVDGPRVRVWVTLYACNLDDNQVGAFPENSILTPWDETGFFAADELIDRCEDFVAWAKAISRLAQRYPHLVGFSIDDFGSRFDDADKGRINSTPLRIRITDEYVAEMVSALRADAPWLNFVPTVYWSRRPSQGPAFADDMPDLGRTFDTILFPFRNQRNHVSNDTLGCDPEGCNLGPDPFIAGGCTTCIAGTCAEKTINNAPAELCDMRRFLGHDRKPILYVYLDGLAACGEPSARYDYELGRLVLKNPWLGFGGAMMYGTARGSGNSCADVPDFLPEFDPSVPNAPLPNKACMVRKLFSELSQDRDLDRVTHIDLTEATCQTTGATGRPFGWVQNASGDQNIVYRGTDGHLHELWRAGDRSGGGDLSASAGAPPAMTSPTAFLGADGVTQYVTYAGAASLHLLAWTTGAPTSYDITGLVGTPADIVPAGYAVPSLGRNEVIVRDTNGHLHEIYWSSLPNFNARDLHEAAAQSQCSAPAAIGNPAGYAFEAVPSQNAIFRGTDGDMHELYWWTGGVCHTNLTENAGTIGAAGDPSAYVAPSYGIQNVVYRAADGNAHELYWSTGDVGASNLTGGLDANPPIADPAAYFAASDNAHHAIYTSEGGVLNELSWTTGAVHVENLQADSQRVPADDSYVDAGNLVPFAYYNHVDGTQHVIYVGRDGHLHELSWGR